MFKTQRSHRLLIGFASVVVSALVLCGAALAQADLSRYVAVGDSLGAGFMSGGLVGEVQAHSYPAQIYRQANGSFSGFEIPSVSEPGIPGLLQLASLSPLLIAPAPGTGQPTNLTLPRPYDNLCVPGAEIDDILNTRSGGLNDLILRGLGTQLEQAIFLQPSFVTLWVNNDALGAAISGVIIEGVTLTTAADFEAKFRTVAGALAGSGAQLAVATIPDVTTIPFVTTLPPVLVDPLTNQPVIINGALVPLVGPDGPLVPGQDFVLLTASAELAAGRGIPVALGGSGQPLSNQAVLSGAEVAVITERVAQFNQVIRATATELGAAVADVNSVFADVVRNNRVIGGIEFNSDFLTGGLFSYDGVHPTPLGYALLADEFILAINETFGNNIPRVDFFPYVFGPFASLGTGFPFQVPAFVFTPKSSRQLREALGVPSRAEINRMLRVRGRR